MEGDPYPEDLLLAPDYDDPALAGTDDKLKAKLEELKKKGKKIVKDENGVEHEEDDTTYTFEDGDVVDYAKPPDTAFAEKLEVDEEGFKPITWTQLRKKFCYERPALGFKIHGDISQKVMDQWERSKQIKIRDCDGVEAAVFFYDDESEPYFSWDDIKVGNTITIKDPRWHRFMDSQEGLRIEHCSQVRRVEKQKFTDASRMDYGTLNKNNGNKKFAEKKYDDAIGFYEAAIRHLEGTFHEMPEHEQQAKELVASCYLNIAACHAAEGKHRFVENPAGKALKINASPQLNAKAYYRQGVAALEMQEYTVARAKLERALELVPGDTAITAAFDRLQQEIAAQKKTEKALFTSTREQMKKEFGLKRRLLSEVPNSLDGVSNFHDAGATADGKALPCGEGRRMKKHVLYRSANLSYITPSDVSVLTTDFGIKTILDMRHSREVNNLNKTAKKEKAAAIAKAELAGDKPPPPFVDVRKSFPVVEVKCKDGAPPHKKIGKVSGKTPEEVLAGRVTIHVDLAERAVMSLAPWWVWLLVLLMGALMMVRWAAKIMLHFTVVKAGPVGLYLRILEKQTPELRFVFNEILAHESNYPVYVCCSMGKDRTGLVIALIQSICGVSDAYIAADYARTTQEVSDDLKRKQVYLGLTELWNVASEETVLSVLTTLRKRHGSVEGYLKSIGVTDEAMRSIREINTQSL